MSILEHKHIIIRAEVMKAPEPHDTEYLNNWMKILVDKLKMKVMMGPYTAYCNMVGNRGFTSICVLETSHAAAHFWDEDTPKLLQLDVYTCGHLDRDVVFDSIKEFEPLKIEFFVVDREHTLKIIQKEYDRMELNYDKN